MANGFRLNNWETAYSRGCSWGIISLCGQNRKNCGETIATETLALVVCEHVMVPFHFESKENEV